MAIGTPVAGALAENASAASSLAVPYPATIAAGDLLLMVVIVSVSTAPNNPSGWTSIVSGGSGTGAQSPAIRWSYKIADGTESGTQTVTMSSSTSRGRMWAISGVDQTTPIDVTGTHTPRAIGEATTHPGVTTTVVDTQVWASGIKNSGSLTWDAITSPFTMTEVIDDTSPYPTSQVSYRLAWTGSGATGDVTFDSANAVRAAYDVFALRPASEAPPSEGAASGSLAWSGSASGASARSGVASGSAAWSGTASGASARSGVASGAAAWTGSASGSSARSGVATGTASWAATAVGVTVKSGVAVGATAWVGGAVGDAPTVGGAEGSATGATAWTGAAAGVSARRGSASGTVAWTGSASGLSSRSGTAAGSTAWADLASGASSRSGVAVGTLAWAGVALGTVPGAVPTAPLVRHLTLTVPERTATLTTPARTASLTAPTRTLTITEGP